MISTRLGRTAALVFAAAVTACASPGPVAMGRDTYLVADTGAYSWSSGAALKASLYGKANEFCAAKGKELMPVNSRQNDGSFSSFAHAELQFRCLDKNDPELGRPTMELTPDIVIRSR